MIFLAKYQKPGKSKHYILLLCFVLLMSFAYAQKGIVNNGAKMIINNGAIIKITGSEGNYTNETFNGAHGRIDLDGKIEIQGDWYNNATSGNVLLNLNSDGIILFNGTSLQNIGGTNPSWFEGLTLSNSSGLNLISDVLVRNTLSLSSGLVKVNDNDLTMGVIGNTPTAGSITGGTFGTSRMIVLTGTGRLIKAVFSTGSYTFPIGENTGTLEYTPVDFNLTSQGGLSSAYVSVFVDDNKLTENTSPSEYLTRYWTLNSGGITSPKYTATYNYLQADVVGAESDIYAAEYNGATRTVFNPVDDANNRFTLASMSSFGDYTGVDGIAPTASLSCGFSNPTNEDTIIFTIEFSEQVENLTFDDITIVNGSTDEITSSDGITFEFEVYPDADGTVTVSLDAGKCTDIAGNDNIAVTAEEIVYDGTAPTVSITSSEPDPTNTDIDFTVTFSEVVENFTDADITISNGTISSFVESVTSPGEIWNVSVHPGNEEVINIDINENVANDIAGNNNTASNELSIRYDVTAPTALLTSAESSPTNASSFVLSIEFNEGINGLTLGDFDNTNCYTDSLVEVVQDTLYTVKVTPDSDGLLTVSIPAGNITDYANNANTADLEYSITYDGTAPTVTISSTETSPTKSTSFDITIQFSEDVSDFTIDDVDVSANCNKGTFTQNTASNYTLELLPQSDGTITVDIQENQAVDNADNGNSPALQYTIIFDSTEPSILSLNPEDEDPSVALSVEFEINFDEIVLANSGNITLYKSGAVWVEDFDVQTEISGSGTSTITFSPTSDLESLTDYYIQIDNGAFKDQAGNVFAGILDNTTWNFTSIDADYPQISTLTPSDNAVGVSIDPTLIITFTENVQANTGNIDIYNSSDALIDQVAVTSGMISGNTLTTTINQTLSGETNYYILIDNDAIRDLLGNPFPGIVSKTRWNFKTEDIAEPTATFTPVDGATGVSYNSNLVIEFNEEVEAGSGDITIVNATTTNTHQIIAAADATINTNIVTINPNDFVSQNNYYVLIDADAFSDTSGNFYAGLSTSDQWNFEIEDINNPTVTVSTLESSPTNTSPFTVTIDFSEEMTGFDENDVDVTNGSATGISTSDNISFDVEITPASDGDVIVKVLAGVAEDLSGNVNQASNSITVTYDSTKPTVVIETLASGTINTGFDITITFSEDVSGFISDNVTLVNCTLSGLTEETTNKVWSATITPDSDGEATVQILADEVTDLAGNLNTISNLVSVTYDATGPQISSLSPFNGETDIDTDAVLQITFDETAIKGSSGNVSVYKSGGEFIESISIDDVTGYGTTTLSIDPVNAFESEMTYYIIISEGAFTDNLGNNFAGISTDATWSFTIADVSKPEILTTVPVNGAPSVAVDANLVITFSETVQKNTVGTITIWDLTNDQLHEEIDISSGQIVVASDIVTIDLSVNFVANTEYCVYITESTFKDLAGNFFAGIVTPTTWAFQAEDNIDPTILSYSPADDDTDVLTTTNLILNFSENIQKATSGNITIVNGTTAQNHEIISVTSDQVVVNSSYVTITPGTSFESFTNYHVLIDANTFEDLAGNPFAGITNSEIWNFVTGDGTPPEILSFVPADNATEVGLSDNLVITFNETVEKGTGNIQIMEASGNFETIDVNSDQVSIVGSEVTISHQTLFATGTEYYVLIDNGAFNDAAGNSFEGITNPATWSFTTTLATPPEILSLSPANGSASVSLTENLVITFNENVFENSGNIVIMNATTASNHETISVTSNQVTISGSQVTINPGVDFDDQTEYYVLIESGAIVDDEGTAFAGITDQSVWSFTTLDLTAPTVSITSTASGTVTDAFTVTVTFSEMVTGFTQDDVLVTNAIITSFTPVTSGMVWDIVIDPVNDGPVTVDIAAGVAQDAAGNDNTAAAQFSVTYDSGVGINNVNQLGVEIYSNADEVIVKFTNNHYDFEDAHIEIYNTIGQKIVDERINSFKEFRTKVDHSSEIYVVKVILDGKIITETLYIE